MTPSNTVMKWNSPKETCTRLMIITRIFNLSRISRSVAEPDFPTFFEHQKQGALLTIQAPIRLQDTFLKGLSLESKLGFE
mmetsp:Transcript_36380/g.86725  ORF Transcript_36380/g.86725 Transcript_36380/m.86725 type:complete len:80 (+) Transcript_36380:1395-1634(+)